MDTGLFEKILTIGVPLIVAITLHEAAHGYVALMFGDKTAYLAKRVTLNPLRHIDPFGTIILPGLLFISGAPFLFGYAKPVPVNFRSLNNPKRDMIWVAAAGPGMNILLAILSALALHLIPLMPEHLHDFLNQMLGASVLVNIVLAVFNMLPLPPLDGGRVAVGLLPHGPARSLASIEPYGFMILIGIMIIPPLFGIPLLSMILRPPVEAIMNIISGLIL